MSSSARLYNTATSTNNQNNFLLQLQRASLKSKRSASNRGESSHSNQHQQSSITKSLERFVGKSAFRVVSNVLVSATLRSPETFSVTGTREPFDCFLSTFKVRSLLEQFGGRYPADAASFIVAFLRSFDEAVEGTAGLVSILGEGTLVRQTLDDNEDFEASSHSKSNNFLESIGSADKSVNSTSRRRNSTFEDSSGSMSGEIILDSSVRKNRTNSGSRTPSPPKNDKSPNNHNKTRIMKIRVTVVWSPKSATNMFSNAISFDCSLVKVEPQAISSFSWTLVNDLHSTVLNLAKIANRSLIAAHNTKENEEANAGDKKPNDLHQGTTMMTSPRVVAGVAVQGIETVVE